jgi:glycosyltransferase involved in cell wall biosynthesis
MTEPIAPLFSIIVPTHDRRDLLHQAIESVVAQTVADWELVVVDDGSHPAAAVPDDDRIRLVRLDTRRGPAAARNAGLAAARGCHVAFLDDDDLYTGDRLELVAASLNDAPVVACWSRFMDRPLDRNTSLRGDVRDVILDAPTPSLGTTTVRRDVCLEFDERWQQLEDIDWWLRTAAVLPVTTVPAVGYLIRRRHEPDPERLEQRAAANAVFIDSHAAYFASHPRARAFRHKREGLLWLATGRASAARRAFVQSLRARPSVRVAWHWVRSWLAPRGPA